MFKTNSKSSPELNNAADHFAGSLDEDAAVKIRALARQSVLLFKCAYQLMDCVEIFLTKIGGCLESRVII